MSAIQDILGSLDLDQVAQYLGVDADTAQSAIQQAVPALLHGLQGEAADPNTATNLANALAQHDNGLVGGSGAIDPNQIDLTDGTKIIQHIFTDQPQVADQANALLGGLGGGLVKKLLPMLAPLVMSWLAGKLLNHPTVQNHAQQTGASGGLGVILGSILGGGGLGSILGGGSTQQQRAPQQQSGGTGDILGSVLGGGGIGSILGSILGGGGAPQVDTTQQAGQYQQPNFNPTSVQTDAQG